MLINLLTYCWNLQSLASRHSHRTKSDRHALRIRKSARSNQSLSKVM